MFEPWKEPLWKSAIRKQVDKELEKESQIKICPECKSRIPGNARRCAHCGAKQGLEKISSDLQTIGAVLLILGVLGIIGYFFLIPLLLGLK